MKQKTYRDMLQTEFELIKKKNKSFSLRSLAKRLDISATHLSLVLLGKKNLSLKRAEDIATKLRWSESKSKTFIHLVEIEHPASQNSKTVALEQINKIKKGTLEYKSIQLDTFEVISKWYYGAILTLLTVKNFKATTLGISNHFKLDSHETKLALERLKRLDLVRLHKNIWVATNNYINIDSISSEAIRKYHKDMLSLASSALDEQSFEERDFANVSLAIDRDKLPEAKKKVKEFVIEMLNSMRSDNATNVYQMSVQLFKLD